MALKELVKGLSFDFYGGVFSENIQGRERQVERLEL